MSEIRTAIVGFGLSGKIFHAPFLEASAHFKLVSIVKRSGEAHEPDYPGAQIVRSFEDVIHDSSIELVVINTPNKLHFSMAKEALLAGKHVVVEKPFVITGDEGVELMELAGKNNRHLFVFHNRRWDGDFMTVRRVVESGVLGDLVSYTSHFDRYAPMLSKKEWKEAGDESVSVLHDLGTHLIDQAVCLFGLPSAVTADLRVERENSKIYDSFDIRLHYSAFYATLKSSLLTMEAGPRFSLHGKNGSFVKHGFDPQEDDLKAGFDPLDPAWGEESEEEWGTLHTLVNGLDSKGVARTLAGNYMGFYENVSSVIKEGAEMVISPQEALLTVRLIEAVQQSHRERKTILL